MEIVFRRSLRSTSGALGDVDWTWTEQIARRQFQLNAKVSANQFWLLVARVDFDSMLSGTCGRHYQKKNLVSIMAAVAKLPSWQDAGNILFHILWTLGSHFPLLWSWCFTLAQAGSRQKTSHRSRCTMRMNAWWCDIFGTAAFDAACRSLTLSPQSRMGTPPTSIERPFRVQKIGKEQHFHHISII